jgi:hypothetical protein
MGLRVPTVWYGELRIRYVWLSSGNKHRCHFLGDYFSCHLLVEVQGNTLHI